MALSLGYASGLKLAPTVVTNAVSNFNQSQGNLNATVSANKYSTTIKFQISPDSGTTWYDATGGTTIANTSSQSVSVSYNATGFYNTEFSLNQFLSSASTYQVRCVATNAIGTTIGNTVSFTTWSLKTYTKTTSGSYSVEIPSITGVAPTIYEMLLFGGGGGANYGGGGGGGYRLFSSHTSSSTGTQTISGTVGVGGTAGNGGTGTGSATSGGNTTLTIGSTTWTGGGGGAGAHPGNVGAPFGRGGTVGTGDNGANLGGTNAYGYYYISGYVQVCTATDKYGNCTATGPDYNQPIYAWNAGYYACGGGGGIDGAGSNASGHTTASQVGGNGGTGGGAYGLRGGNGGGGGGTQGFGSNGSLPAWSGPVVGTGGQGWYGNGVAGGITFKYYGP